MTTYSNEDQFSDAFAEFFINNVDTYGDTDESIEEAYNDFVKNNTIEDTYSEEIETEDTYSEEELQHAQEFAEFYSDMSDVYSDDETGLDEAYNDFMELNDAMNTEDTYSEETEDEYSEEELAFIEYYSDNVDAYGENVEEAYNDFMEVVEEVYSEENEIAQEDNYSDLEDVYGDSETFASDFADFYSELEDVYGDDIEMAFDDYADALEEIANGDNYSEEVETETEDTYAMKMPNMPKMGNKAKAGMKGAGIGAAAGLAMGTMMDPKAKERKALKAKVKAGTATEADKTKLAELKKARRARLMKATGAGAVAGWSIRCCIYN